MSLERGAKLPFRCLDSFSSMLILRVWMFLLKSCLKVKLIKNSSFHFQEDFEGEDERVPSEMRMIEKEEEKEIAQADHLQHIVFKGDP